MSGKKARKRCQWAQSDALLAAYHDGEWGVPVHDDRLLFEMLTLEGAQAGLSWLTILRKRENYRAAFDRFDARKIARYDAAREAALRQDAGIVRNRLKIHSVVENAKSFLQIQREFGSFDAYLWRFSEGVTVKNRAGRLAAERLSKDLKRRGFRFVGGEICYAFLQAVGVVNDHAKGCFRA